MATNPRRVNALRHALHRMQETKQSEAGAGSGLRGLWPSCREVSRLQSAATEQPLSLGGRIGLKFHLLVCGWCRRYGRNVRILRDHQHDETAAPGLSPDSRERMKHSIEKGGMK